MYPEILQKKNNEMRPISQKTGQVQSLNSFTNQLDSSNLLSFLAGYVISDLQILTMKKQCSILMKTYFNCLDLMRDKVLHKRNILELTIDSLQQTKKLNYKIGQIVSKNIFSSRKQENIFETFIQNFQNKLGELVLDNNFLKNEWLNKQAIQMQEEKQKMYIKTLMEKEEKQYKIGKMKMQEQNEKLLKNFLQIQKQEHQKQLKILQENNLECQICLDSIDYQDIGLLECSHSFHRNCLFEHIKSNIQENNVNIPCPMQGCKQNLTVNDVQEYIDGDLLQKFDSFSLNKYVQMNGRDTSWCPTAGCGVIFEYDEMLDNFRCPKCKKHYCLKCRCDYHYGMSCDEYRINNNYSEQDKMFEGFVRGAKYKQCPKCKFWVQRSQGCSTMSCRCGQQFCYECGGTRCPHGSCSGSGRK